MADSKKENALEPSNAGDKPPSARTRSSYHLESNPFEVSFSQPHPNPSIPAFAPPSPPRRASSKERTNADQKPKLPPIAAMASPAGTSDFAWPFNAGSGTGDVNSLRNGPLSPAMLAGPAQYSHHSSMSNGGVPGFEGIRTGLTPDVSRTGLTPLIGGPTSFPPPSPNTAAFLAIVNANAGAAPGTQPATITPGTFSAITGAMLNTTNTNNNSNGTGSDLSSTSPSQSHHPHPHAPHPLSVSHLPGGAENAEDPAHTAANGLFLLSQAHQELTKREEQLQQQQPPPQLPSNGRNSSRRNNNATNNNTTAPSNNKRKGHSNAAPAAPEPVAKKARGAAARAATTTSSGRTVRHTRKRSVSTADEDDDDDEDMDLDGEDGEDRHGSDEDELEAAARVGTLANGKNPTPMMKKPETEEEKRKNFLERNRQGQSALLRRCTLRVLLIIFIFRISFICDPLKLLSGPPQSRCRHPSSCRPFPAFSVRLPLDY